MPARLATVKSPANVPSMRSVCQVRAAARAELGLRPLIQCARVSS